MLRFDWHQSFVINILIVYYLQCVRGDAAVAKKPQNAEFLDVNCAVLRCCAEPEGDSQSDRSESRTSVLKYVKENKKIERKEEEYLNYNPTKDKLHKTYDSTALNSDKVMAFCLRCSSLAAT